jgi:glycosyltransferase involved in cell wall biosynthesis
MLNWRDPRNPLSGGAERVTEAYLAALTERGHEVFWYANDFPGATRSETIRGIHIARGGGRGGSVLKARQWYRRQPRFDLVIDQHHGIPWFAPWWAGTNCISYIHEVLGPIWNSFYSWPLSWLGRMQERWTHWMYRNVPFWVGCQSTKEALHRHGVRTVTVVSYGTDLEALRQLEPKPLRQPLALIAVSRLAPNKRIDHALEALRCLLRRGLDAHLTIVGTGDMEGALRQTAAQPELAGKVVFTGQLPEDRKNEELRRAHLLLHTSVREGWGLNVLEASAMGTPAVVYPVPGLVDSTVHDRTGIVTRAESPAAVADAVAELLKRPDKYERLRQEGCQRARTFHWSQVLPRACDWLEEQARGQITATD